MAESPDLVRLVAETTIAGRSKNDSVAQHWRLRGHDQMSELRGVDRSEAEDILFEPGYLAGSHRILRFRAASNQGTYFRNQ